MTKRCPKCNLEKPWSEYSKTTLKTRRGYAFSRPVAYCHPCWLAYQRIANKKRDNAYFNKARRERSREFLVSLKNRPCADCGISYPHYVMDFDHLPEFPKLGEVGKLVNQHKFAEAIEESKKCELVCANCHRVRTFKRQEFGRKPKVRMAS